MTEPSARPIPSADSLVLFFSGSTLGSLKPCGCSGGQLGGLEKRATIFNEAPAGQRLVLDTGAMVQSDGDQDLIKFRVLFEAFRLLGYDGVNLTPPDVEMAESLGLAASQEHPFAVISSDSSDESEWGVVGEMRSRGFTKKCVVSGREIAVNVAAFDAQADLAERAADFFELAARGQKVNILILQNSDAESLAAWAPTSGADCIICPSTSDEPQLLSEPGAEPMVFTVGRFGRHICRVQVALSGPGRRPALHFADIPVTEDLPQDEALVRLYRQYQQLVRDSNLLEKYPRVPLPNDLRYAGSKSCEPCHLYEFAMWSIRAHADAFATLVEVGSDRDPECVICHVVGMDRESGFITEERTPGLKDVGCETCHGPGLEHNTSQGLTPTTEPKAACLDCHTPEHSRDYAGHEEQFREKIMHWWEP